jgi:hypothetical protein
MASGVVKARLADLSPDVRAFLRSVVNQREAHPMGLYHKKTGAWTWVAAVVGAGLLLGPAVWFLGRNPRWESIMPEWWVWGVVVLGAGMLGAALDTLLRRERSPEYLGRFEFVGPKGWWTVGPGGVEVRSHAGIGGLRLVHHYTNGAYQHTAMHLELPGGVRVVNVSPQARAERIAHYLSVIVHLTTKTDPALRASVLADTELLGRIARQVVDGAREFVAPATTGLREPELRPSQGGYDGLRLGLIAAGALVGVVLCGTILPAAFTWRKDQVLYGDVLAAPEGNPEPAEIYLLELPRGRHATEVRDTRDDQRFAKARTEAERDASPSSLRAYLVDDENQRHREEALDLVAGFYQQAIARVQALRTPYADAELVDGLLAVLTALQQAESPVVGVTFQGTQQPLPMGEGEQLIERLGESFYASSDAKIKELQEADDQGSAMIELGGTFDDAQVQRRESVILARLQTAIDQVLGLDILALRPATEGETPVFAIAYHTFPSGEVYLYTRETTEYPSYGLPTGPGSSTTTATMGLLRGYAIAWTVTVTPPGGQPIVRELGSVPADSLRLEDSETAPDWAPYAVILYSAFHDFSSELILRFGLTPPPAPNVFSFDDATGSRQNLDEPAEVPGGVPGGVLSPEQLEQMLKALEGLEGLEGLGVPAEGGAE